MNINLNTTIHSGTVNGVSTTNAPAKDNAIVNNALPRQNLTVSFAKVDDSASVDEIADEVFVRDDALGKAVTQAFNLPAPPMPDFEKQA